MKKNQPTLQGCPYDNLTESLCLDINLSDAEKRKAQIHLQQCEECREKFQELEGIYSQLNEEVSKPVSNKVLDLAKQIKSENTRYGLVVCEPEQKKNAKAQSFRSTVLFTANGTGANHKKKLSDFDLTKLPKDNIAIRAMTDASCNQILLYLWSSNNSSFEGWELKLSDKSQRAVFNQAGVSHMPMMKIEELGDKVIYFKEKQNNVSASENRFSNIIGAISAE
jgi:hypothetical protein